MQVSENGVDFSGKRVGENATYFLKKTATEFIETFSHVLEEQIEEKLKRNQFISIVIDESTDASVQKKLVVYCGTVDND